MLTVLLCHSKSQMSIPGISDWNCSIRPVFRRCGWPMFTALLCAQSPVPGWLWPALYHQGRPETGPSAIEHSFVSRWRIENSGFRELKEGWHLQRAPWSYTNSTVVAARTAFTLITFNVAQIAKTAQGRRLTDRGVRRLRRELAQEYGPAHRWSSSPKRLSASFTSRRS